MSLVPSRFRGLGIGALAPALGLSLCLFAAPSAAAASPSAVRYHRPSGKVKTRSRLDTKANKARAEAEREPPTPGIDGSVLHGRKPSVTLAVLDSQIAVARRLVKEGDASSAEWPGFVHRLAGLHLDKRAIFELQAGAAYERIHALEKSRRGQAAKTERARQKRLFAKARAEGIEAARVMQALVDMPRWTKYDRRDEMLYDLALVYGQLGRETEMKQTYAKLISDHPTSRFRPHVYVAFADHEFDAGRVSEANKLYDQVIDAYADSPMYAYALYKSAWCQLNPAQGSTPDYAKSLSRFVEAIEATEQGRAGSEANAKQIRREARRDLVQAYVHVARPSKAWEFFSRVGQGPTPAENMQRTQMELLAAAYFGEGMYVESTATYRALQERFEGDAAVCGWQGKIVINALATDDPAIQWKEAERLAETWADVRDSKHDKRTKRQCRNAARDTLAQLGTTWHDEALKTGRATAWENAERAYAEFLAQFPRDEDAYELAFYLAEVHWARAEQSYAEGDREAKQEGLAAFERAHDAFVRVLEMDPDGKLTRDAAYGQMLALKNAMEYDETAGPRPACAVQSDGSCEYGRSRSGRRRGAGTASRAASDRFEPREYDPASAKMLAAYDRYETYVDDPDDPQLPKILYHRVKLMMDHNRFDEARPALQTLVKKFDGTVYAVWSAEMLLDVLTIEWADSAKSDAERMKAGETLDAWAAKLQKSKTFRHAEAERVRAQVPRLRAAVGWTIAEGLRKRGEAEDDPELYVQCAEKFVDLYETYTDHDRADDLLFNAARCYEAGYRVGAAIKVRQVLLEQHPDSARYRQTLKEAALNYQAIAFYAESAQLLEQFADEFPQDDYAPSALSNAFLFRRGLGEESEAKSDLAKYEALFRRKNPKRAAEIFWSEGDLLDDEEARLQHARSYIARYGRKGGKAGLALAHARVGEILWARSCKRAGPDGVCVTIKRRKVGAGQSTQDAADGLRDRTRGKLPERCGSATQGVITVHARDPKLARQAQEHLLQAIASFEKAGALPEDPDQARAIRDAWGMALVRRADETYEAYLRVQMPDDLSFGVDDWKKGSGIRKWEREYEKQVARRKDSEERFGRFFEDKKRLGRDLVDQYAQVKQAGSPHWQLAALARTGVVSQNFADQLYRAKVPAELRTQDQVDAYCDRLADFAAPLEDLAVASFDTCLQRSTEFSFFNEHSRACEEEMQQRRPDDFPATNELFDRSRYTDSKMDRVRVQVSLTRDR